MNSDPALTDPHQPRRRAWKRPAIFLIILFVLSLVGLLSHDEKLKPYEDLIGGHAEAPDPAQNGWWFLEQKRRGAPKPKASERERLHRMTRGVEPWDETLLNSMRAGSESDSVWFHQAVEMPSWRPIPNSGGSLGAGSGFLMDLRRQLAAEAVLSAERGRLDSAISTLRDLLKCGSLQCSESQGVNDFMSGHRLRVQAAELTCELLRIRPGDESLLADLEGIWSNDAPITPAMVSAVLTPEVRQFNSALETSGPVTLELTEEPLPAASRWLIQKNATRNDYHTLIRHVRDHALDTCASKESSLAAQLDLMSRPRTVFSLNYTGRRLVRAWILPLGLCSNELFPAALFVSRAMVVRLGLERWRLTRNGQLPVTLEELIPTCLSAIPADPWNGKFLLWDHEKQVIFAVGSDWKPQPAVFHDGPKDVFLPEWFGNDAATPGLRLHLPSVPSIFSRKAP